MRSFRFYFIAFCFYLILNSSSAVVRSPPEIFVANDTEMQTFSNGQFYIDIITNRTLVLECEAEEFVTWSLSQQIQDRAHVSNNCSDVGCTSTLSVRDMQFQDTGEYKCSLNSSNVSWSSVYAFVNDLDHLIVPVDNMHDIVFLVVNQLKATVVPCKSSYSRANVSLRSSTTDNYRKIGNEYGVTFDPTTGFKFKRPHWNDEWSSFVCEVRMGNTTQESQYIIHWSVEPSYQLFPEIEVNSRYVIINESVNLECSVQVEVGVTSSIMWTSTANFSGIQVSETEIVRLGEGKYFFNQISKNLTIKDVQQEHEGWYTCTVMDSMHETYSTRKFLTVFKAYPNPQVHLFADFDASRPLTVSSGSNLTIVMKIEAFPSIESVQFVWYKNAIKLNRGFEVYQSNGHLITTFPIVSEVDTGNYTLVAAVGRVRKEFEIQLEVLSVSADYSRLLVAAILLCVICTSFCTYTRKYRGKYVMKSCSMGEKVACTYSANGYHGDEDADRVDWKLDKALEVTFENVTFGEVIGQGEYGLVTKARARKVKGFKDDVITVAVKRMKPGSPDSHKRALTEELKVLGHIGRHENVVNLLGYILKPSVMIVVEFCALGCLRSFLISKRAMYARNNGDNDLESRNRANSCDSGCPTSSSSLPLSYTNPLYYIADDCERSTMKNDDSFVPQLTDLVKYALDIASGMAFLTSRKLIHRDLACRNVLMSTVRSVKICDFGLSKNCYYYDELSYTRKTDIPMAIKWLAIESIRDKVFTEKSDIWSYGITLWEIFSLGADPYPGEQVGPPFFERICAGHRLLKPQWAPQAAYELMSKCWLDDAQARPTFRALAKMVEVILEDLVYSTCVEKYQEPAYANLPVRDDYDSVFYV
ncbi:Vascular endothelial growth factor receptor 3 [Halotydeus destructor]|nr:Vascular endothelial growth factor receptor 3 [Halotydeus destructor]